MARAKTYLIVFGCLTAAGCAGGLKRLAPPGIVKYEDLSKGQPINPEIAQSMQSDRRDKGGPPDLSTQPKKAPEGIAPPERKAIEASLEADGQALAVAVAADRDAADEERSGALEDVRAELADKVGKDVDAARKERRLAPMPKIPSADTDQ